MAIISSQVIEDQAQKDGRRSIRERHIDHLGTYHFVQYLADVGMDINAIMLARIPFINTMLVDNEEQKLISKFEEEHSDPTAYTFNFTTKQAFLRRLIRYLMKHRDVKIIVAIKPMIDWLKATYTAAQIATYLGITTVVLGRINTRLDAIFAIAAVLETDNNLIEEI